MIYDETICEVEFIRTDSLIELNQKTNELLKKGFKIDGYIGPYIGREGFLFYFGRMVKREQKTQNENHGFNISKKLRDIF